LEHRADYSVSWSFTGGRFPWTGDQLVARPLPKHRSTQTQEKLGHTLNIHAQGGIRTRNHGLRAIEDCSCLRLFGYRGRLCCWVMGGISWNGSTNSVSMKASLLT
jgi:hypothetical protein